MKKKKKRKLKLIKIRISRKDRSSRLIVRGRPIVGINSHGMYEADKTLHIHIGDKRKIVLYPKGLRGVWTRKGKKYVRTFPKDVGKKGRRPRRSRKTRRS